MSYAITIRNEEESRVLLGRDRGEYPFVAIMEEDNTCCKIVSVFDDVEKIYDIPVMEFREITIVKCATKEEIRDLFDATYSWSSTAFDDTDGFGFHPCFIVSGSKLCRWYSGISLARESFPWAPVVEASSFGETFNKISLSEVLQLRRTSDWVLPKLGNSRRGWLRTYNFGRTVDPQPK